MLPTGRSIKINKFESVQPEVIYKRWPNNTLTFYHTYIIYHYDLVSMIIRNYNYYEFNDVNIVFSIHYVGWICSYKWDGWSASE